MNIRASVRALCFALCLALCLCPLLAACGEEVYYIAPKLSSDAEPYDPEHPEKLKTNQLYAKSAILIRADTGEVILEKDADTRMYPASTTKILTVLLGLQYGDLDETVYLTENDMAGIASDDATMGLEVGESINFKDLLYGTFIRSANEGANLIAESVGGNIQNFVDLMNEAAYSYGCTDTHFANPNGLHDDAHYSTARDMAKIAQVAMQNEQFRDIAKSYTYSLPKSNIHRSRVLTHSSRCFFNPSLEENEFYYSYAIGIKSGYHARAGYCFVGAAERDGIELISVVFYTTKDGRWTDTQKLMDYGFSQFVSMTPLELYAMNPITVETSGFALDDEGYGHLQLNAVNRSGNRTIHIVATQAQMETKSKTLRQTAQIEYTRSFTAPIEQGEELGTLTYYPEDGSDPVIYSLVASRSVKRRENMPLTLEEIINEVYNDPNPLPPFNLEFALFLLVPAALLFLLIRGLARLSSHKKGKGTTGHKKRMRIPKPTNRYFR